MYVCIFNRNMLYTNRNGNTKSVMCYLGLSFFCPSLLDSVLYARCDWRWLWKKQLSSVIFGDYIFITRSSVIPSFSVNAAAAVVVAIADADAAAITVFEYVCVIFPSIGMYVLSTLAANSEQYRALHVNFSLHRSTAQNKHFDSMTQWWKNMANTNVTLASIVLFLPK